MLKDMGKKILTILRLIFRLLFFGSNRTFFYDSGQYGPCSEKTRVIAECKDRFLVTRYIIIMWFDSLKIFFPDYSFIYIHEYLMSQPFVCQTLYIQYNKCQDKHT